MERGISLLQRFDLYFRWTRQYAEVVKMVKACNEDVMKIITAKKQQINNIEMNPKDATSFLEYLCCIAKERPSSLTDEEIQNELNLTIFAVIKFFFEQYLYNNCHLHLGSRHVNIITLFFVIHSSKVS